jgi:hypothetical protein
MSLQQQLQAEIERLKSDCVFIETANKGGEFMSVEAKERVKAIANLSLDKSS